MPTADELLGPEVLRALIASVERAAPGRELSRLRAAGPLLGPLSLRQRTDLLKDALLADLPGDYPGLESTVRTALGDEAFSGWLIWPVTEAVTAGALRDGSGRAFDAALALLAELSPRLTSEFAVRPLLAADLGRAIPIVLGWTAHSDERVRRLASEGTRPFLPWAIRVPAIIAEPASTVPILDALYRDESEFVRRSVANHLNDLSRQNPALVVKTASRWMSAPDANTPRLIRHALRTLIKRGDPGALGLLGFAPAPAVVVTGPVLGADTVAIGGRLPFEVRLENTGDVRTALAVDYVVHHRKANGSQTTKVFKLTTRSLAAGESALLVKVHSFEQITTRAYHPGEHALEVQVNGVLSGRVAFQLTRS
ncbi:MAG TPA: DNA alkylation repair protein [Lacisediminihabitans sp.]|uniref:DNA alkylation repair protein n=1 Tax=Lacisediminihabitans sp. TaxID=2787631 RepID=UPI002EDB36F6